MTKVLIIGAGSVGINTALFLDKLGFEVTLLESENDILQGSPQASFIEHSDGFEYHKIGHQTTGQYCIDGAITNQLLASGDLFRTIICNKQNPIRFLVSEKSDGVDGLTLPNFYRNAEHMRKHFTKRFDHLKEVRGWGDARAEKVLLRNPTNFASPLENNQFDDIATIVGGYAGSSGGINMAHYYAYLKACLRESGIKTMFGQNVDSITKTGDNYLITTAENIIEADYIAITAGHKVPELQSLIEGSEYSASGTYYLNTMTMLDLPPTNDKELLKKVSRVNFTLQQEGGCMYACVVAPTETEKGLAAIYFPSETGSQVDKHVYDKNSRTPPPAEWDEICKTGLPLDHPNIQRIFAQACQLYPFLENYAVVNRNICRTVFNVDAKSNDTGLDRRVRVISSPEHLTEDGLIVASRSPKWTNASLVAFNLVEEIMQKFRNESLGIDPENGFGPLKLDIPAITEKLHFKNVKLKPQDALDYCRRNQLPERLVSLNQKELQRQL